MTYETTKTTTNNNKQGKDYILTADHESDFKKWKDAIDKAAEVCSDEHHSIYK